MKTQIRIGTRGSRLALWQAEEAARRLGASFRIVKIQTAGDRDRSSALPEGGSQGFFAREIERALLADQVDVAVHSLKDLPTQGPDGLRLGAVLERGPASDLLLVHPSHHAPEQRMGLAAGSRVGTGSLRRQALLEAFAPQAAATVLRGNVQTRLRRCLGGELDAVILARAGIERLGLDLSRVVAYELDPFVWIPAPAQGAIALQIREDDCETAERLRAADHGETRQAVEIERALMARAEGGCHAAFGAYAGQDKGVWRVDWGLVAENRWAAGSCAGTSQQCLALDPLQGVRAVTGSTLRVVAYGR